MKFIQVFLFFLGVSFQVNASELGDLFDNYQAALKGGNLSEVVASAETVYGFCESNLPDSSKSRAAATLNYGMALASFGKKSEAELYLRKAVKRYQSIYGEDALEVISPLMELAKSLAEDFQRSSRPEYRRPLKKALKIAKLQKGEESAFYAILSFEAGQIAMDYARDTWAYRYLVAAQDAFSGPFKEHTYYGFLSDFYLGKYLMLKGKYKEAEPYLLNALELADIEENRDEQLELVARAFLVEIFEKTGQVERSIEQCRRIGQATPFDMDQEPQPLFSPGLKYPKAALRTNMEGHVVASFTISDTGIPIDIEILETKGTKEFGRAAEEYLAGSRFAPRFIEGTPVETPDRRIRFNFNIAK
ncbi:TonB family protein [Microbulbifer echini]|uniref:TonB family protein n=1 Tax=Microbulbifer echini TaxID=1529067 RepID=A0ABV4NQF3_9GAMM